MLCLLFTTFSHLFYEVSSEGVAEQPSCSGHVSSLPVQTIWYSWILRNHPDPFKGVGCGLVQASGCRRPGRRIPYAISSYW